MRNLKLLGGALAMTLLMLRPQAATRGAALAMAHWYASVAPALFPFLALMPLLTCREALAAYEGMLARPMGVWFNLPGAATPGIVAGLVAGTPAGALAARRAAAGAGMNQGQLHRIAAAAAGFSPAFLVGGIGVGMLNSAALGWKLWEAQLLTQFTLLVLLRHGWEGRTAPVALAGGAADDRPVTGAVAGILMICGYMALFGALAGAVGALVGRGPADVLLCLLDVPSGALRVSGMALPDGLRLPLLAGMCGFGGMCVIAQSLGALRDCGVRAWEYMGVRILAGLLSAGYAALLQTLPALADVPQLEPIRKQPMAAGALVAALLAIPVLTRRYRIKS